MLPGASGFDICKAARKKGDCPIIFLTALGAEPEIMKGYEIGCDDYVVKPFSIRHLYAKSLALLKRAKGEKAAETLSCGAITNRKYFRKGIRIRIFENVVYEDTYVDYDHPEPTGHSPEYYEASRQLESAMDSWKNDSQVS